MKEETTNTVVQINEEEIGKLPEKDSEWWWKKDQKTCQPNVKKMQESINKDLEELKINIYKQIKQLL